MTTPPFAASESGPASEAVDYRLVDFGDGWKLETLGDYRIVRPSPAAEGCPRRRPRDWDSWDARFDSEDREWHFRQPWPERLVMGCGSFVMPLRPTPFGHLGVFPEQAENWAWLAQRPVDAMHGLNLFGYTGASTLAMVTAGFVVAHVDAAKPNVVAASEAARINGWDHPPIRFLVDDATKFTARERRRERRYHTITLDPPAYGHPPRGRAWRIERDLWPLLDNVIALLSPDAFRLLVTGHSPQVDAADVVRYLKQDARLAARFSRIHITAGRSQLKDASGRPLDTGFVVRAQYGAS